MGTKIFNKVINIGKVCYVMLRSVILLYFLIKINTSKNML